MKTKLFSALLILVLIPSVVFAARPSITSLQQQINELTAIVKGLDEELTKTRAELVLTQEELAKVQSNTVLDLDGLLSLKQIAGYNTAIFDGINVQLINGAGVTNALNGRGNFIIGYNVDSSGVANRIGSHNVILGDDQSYANTEEVITENILSNRDLMLTVANNLNTVVGTNQTTTVGANRAVSIGANQTTTVGSSKTESVGQDKIQQISGTSSIVVGLNASMDIGQNMNMNIGQDAALMIGNLATIDVGDELLMISGVGSHSMKKSGDIVIRGKSLDIKMSGDIIMKATKIIQN